MGVHTGKTRPIAALAAFSNHRFMSPKIPVLIAICLAFLFPACGEKSEMEKAEEERAVEREKKRVQAIQTYQDFIKAYPDDPRAEEAKRKLAALEAAGKKK